jgi:hypothetical protein
MRQLCDYVWWSEQDAADYANGQLSEALRQLRAGELAEEYAPSEAELERARRELANDARRRGTDGHDHSDPACGGTDRRPPGQSPRPRWIWPLQYSLTR